MKTKEKELTAYCGLYCGDCIRYKSKASQLARELKEELQRTQFEKYAEVKSKFVNAFKNYKECVEVLDAIADLQCNNTCRGGGCPTFKCKIIECCNTKGLEGCWECNKFENCKELDFLEPFHGDLSKKNLRKIKELGLEKWLKHREKFFKWL